MNATDSIKRQLANQLFRFKQRQLKAIFSSEVDKVEIASALLSIYRKLGKKEPEIHFVSGPGAAMQKMAELTGNEPDQFGNTEIKHGTLSHSIRKDLDAQIFADLKSIKEEVKDQMGKTVFREAVNILFRDLNFQVSQAIYHQVERSFSRMAGYDGGMAEFNPHPSFADWDWISFYRGCNEVIGVGRNVFTDFERLLSGGFYSGFFHEDFCIAVTKPLCFRRNENLVLHDEDLPAVEWKDGTKLCFWNGMNVPEKLICDPLAVKAEDILQESNAEVRRCYQEKLGSERFGSLLGLVELDRKADRFGNESVLFRTKRRDKLAGDYIYFAKVVCPSTGRSYFLCVPPWMKGVEEAISWTFGKSPDDYRPILET